MAAGGGGEGRGGCPYVTVTVVVTAAITARVGPGGAAGAARIGSGALRGRRARDERGRRAGPRRGWPRSLAGVRGAAPGPRRPAFIPLVLASAKGNAALSCSTACSENPKYKARQEPRWFPLCFTRDEYLALKKLPERLRRRVCNA